jgi:hypothetical protein
MGALRLPAGALLLALSFAPYQCAREPDPNRRIEEEPAEAVYKLAERFKAEGKADARATTLKYIVERFPTSRFAKSATQELQEMGQSVPAPADTSH